MCNFTLISQENIFTIVPLLQVLNPTIPEEVIKSRLKEMLSQGYECVGIFDTEKLIGISGLWIRTQYYIGKHIEPDNVIILPEYRNQGIGEKLMLWIYDYAKSKGCIASELNCYVQNEKGNNFWRNEGYQIIGNHYQKKF
ncbi:MAG: GNAT family N-acetyltransferase [Bacteroidetes bacterium]|nr:GNAT family N-acetyltransferase [Bacteroidota bacterium]